MSVTLPSVRARIRVKLREADARHPLGLVEVDQAIRDTYLALQSRLPAAQTQVDSAFTIAAGADTFTLPSASSEEYSGEVRIRLRSLRYFLTKSTHDEMDRFRNWMPASFASVPTHFLLYEEVDQTVPGICYPPAKSAEACDLFRGVVASDFDLTAVDATNIRFSRYAITALVDKTAAVILASLTDEDLKLRRLNPRVAQVWDREAEIMLYQEACRRHDLESTGRTQRLVS